MLENNIVVIGGEKRPSNTLESFDPKVITNFQTINCYCRCESTIHQHKLKLYKVCFIINVRVKVEGALICSLTIFVNSQLIVCNC